MPPPADARDRIDAIWRAESRRVFATLVRLLGDFDLAEEALHDAFAAALERWPDDGVPERPRQWLVSAGRFKALDAMRRRARFDEAIAERAARADEIAAAGDETFDDDRLRLIFTCCHPALPGEAQVALTLREVCGLATEAIARAFLVAPSTLAQRIVRARNRIRDLRIRTQCRRRTSCRRASTPCCASSTSCSTKAMPRRPVRTSCSPSSAPKRCAFAGSSPTCCRSRRRSACWG
jgi:RNA polymerase sigma-70 factor (ECF subfamily)